MNNMNKEDRNKEDRNMNNMNKEDNKDNKDNKNRNIELWIDALRSGLYQQGRGYLKMKESDDDKFCCLGIACEIYQREVGDLKIRDFEKYSIKSNPSLYKIYSYDNERRVLPSKVQEWLGLSSDSGHFDKRALTDMNDNGASFDQIADLIESCPSGLFI